MSFSQSTINSNHHPTLTPARAYEHHTHTPEATLQITPLLAPLPKTCTLPKTKAPHQPPKASTTTSISLTLLSSPPLPCAFSFNSFNLLYTFAHKLKLALVKVLLGSMIGLTICLTISLSAAAPAHAMISVIDPSLIRENVMQRVLAIEQWARNNLNQLEQITRLDTGNEILDNTQQLMAQNYAMEYKESWQQIKHLQEESLTLLHAAKSMWEEFGSSQHYYAAFHKAQAWENCMHQQHCTFATALNELHDKSITQALQAYHNAEEMNAKLQAQIEQLQQLNSESQTSTSAAGTLDAMSKINGHVASSMIDLNNQIAQLTKLQSHEMAQQNNESLAQDSYIRAITDFSSEINERPIPYQLP